ncbi:hypothetical protein N783_14640 [Pontibacillus marinus BH030004 = DSM 16465]|uniref:Uncharacterized protein n=1 Tax=Pontibacillus marinus BH030004 = DSM 16465 TaxID=1385511 RepID=A0A0A5FX60_9BACI|nr:hypothetical protein N783_14640 [Pontibacillus marinus BH030004 = DSM 16465]
MKIKARSWSMLTNQDKMFLLRAISQRSKFQHQLVEKV